MEIRNYEDKDEKSVVALWQQVLPDSAPHNDPIASLHRKVAADSLGQVLETSKQKVLTIIMGLEAAGARAVVLANTELPLLISSEDTSVKLFDTMAIHVKKAVSWALEGSV